MDRTWAAANLLEQVADNPSDGYGTYNDAYASAMNPRVAAHLSRLLARCARNEVLGALLAVEVDGLTAAVLGGEDGG